MRRCVLVMLAILVLAAPRASAQPAPANADPMEEPRLTMGCAAGSLAGGYAARTFGPLIATISGAAFIGGTILVGCVAGAVAGAWGDARATPAP